MNETFFGAALRRITGRQPDTTRPASIEQKLLQHLDSRLQHLASRVEHLERAQTVYLGDHEALTRLYSGHRIYVDTRDVGICSHLMLEGRWEPWVEQVIRARIKPGMQVADIGANFGYYTLLMADWVGAAGHVHAFEANPQIFTKLRKSVAVNGFADRVTLFPLAAHHCATQLDFEFVHEFSGGGGSRSMGCGDGWQVERIQVQAAPLDAVLRDVPSLDFLKIDVEGAEPHVLAGSTALLQRSPVLSMVIEFEAQATAALTDPLQYLQGFVASGFALQLVLPEGVSEVLAPQACLDRLGGALGYLLLTRG